MKKLALVTTLLAFVTADAMAADMPLKAVQAPPPMFNWTGFYIGGNVGGAWNDTRDSVSPTGCFINPAALCGGSIAFNPLRSDVSDMRGAGFTGGLQGGYNWQIDRWVFGWEGDVNYVGINDSIVINRALAAPLVGTWAHSETDKSSWLGTLRARVGVAATPSFLLYATGGLAVGEIRSSSTGAFTTGDSYFGSNNDTRFGWTVGAGGEWMISPQWSIKAEYLYVDLGKNSYSQNCAVPGACTAPPLPAAATYQTELRVHENIARVGFNYHFGVPVDARY